MITFAMPAAMIASAQGPVRPWCEHGSRVTTIVAPTAGGAGATQRLDFGVGLPGDLRVALAHDNPAIADHECSDPGIGR